jgi:predicted amidohydrolase
MRRMRAIHITGRIVMPGITDIHIMVFTAMPAFIRAFTDMAVITVIGAGTATGIAAATVTAAATLQRVSVEAVALRDALVVVWAGAAAADTANG